MPSHSSPVLPLVQCSDSLCCIPTFPHLCHYFLSTFSFLSLFLVNILIPFTISCQHSHPIHYFLSIFSSHSLFLVNILIPFTISCEYSHTIHYFLSTFSFFSLASPCNPTSLHIQFVPLPFFSILATYLIFYQGHLHKGRARPDL